MGIKWTVNTIVLLMAFTTLGIVQAFAQGNVAQEAWTLTSDSAGCKAKADTDKMAALVVAGDRGAAAKFFASRREGDACKIVPEGPVFVQEASVFGNPCVRVRSDVDCYYVARAKLEKKR